MKTKLYLAMILAAVLFSGSAGANDVFIVIEGKVVKTEAQKSITIEMKNSGGVELSLADVQTLSLLDPKKLTDGVREAIAIGAAGGGIGGAARTPDTSGDNAKQEESKLKNAGLASLIVAGLSVAAVTVYNWFTIDPPVLIYDADNETLNNPALVTSLPAGTKVRIVQKRRIQNGINHQSR